MSRTEPEALAHAFALYQQEKLTLGQAARLVDMGRFEFQRLLAQHGIPLTLDVDDLEQDLNTLRQLGLSRLPPDRTPGLRAQRHCHVSPVASYEIKRVDTDYFAE